MRNLTFTEKRFLVIKHVREGYSYDQALKMVKDECDSFKEVSKEERKKEKKRKKKVTFKDEFDDLIKNK